MSLRFFQELYFFTENLSFRQFHFFERKQRKKIETKTKNLKKICNLLLNRNGHWSTALCGVQKLICFVSNEEKSEKVAKSSVVVHLFLFAYVLNIPMVAILGFS